MANGEDWLLRPVLRKLLNYKSLIDGTVDLEDVAKLNDALDVSDENEARLQKAAERGR
jgi:hypothetical protein